MEEIKGLKEQVSWCVNAIQVLIKSMKEKGYELDIQDPPTGPPPTNP